MSGEGEGGPAAPGSWRRRWLSGLFALVALGLSAAAVLPLVDLGSRLRVGGASVAWVGGVSGIVALACTALSRRPRRCSGAGRTAAPAPLPRSEGVRSLPPLSGPGPARELLALFALPSQRVSPRTPVAEGHGRDVVCAQTVAAPVRAAPPMIRLYGPLAVDGTAGDPLRRRAVRGLIAYLVLRRAPASLDELAHALWPGLAQERARARLHKAKWHAQHALGAALVRRGDGYALDLSLVRIDVVEVERAAASSQRVELERAVAVSRGEPLVDVDYAFADGERRRLESIRVDLLARVARARLDDGEPSAALEAAEELIAVDALNESGWRLAMEAEGGLGSRQAIVARYQRLERELGRTLGLRPQAETRAVFRRLLGQA